MLTSTVNPGKGYTCEGFTRSAEDDCARAQSITEHYKPGKVTNCFVNPRDPRRALMEKPVVRGLAAFQEFALWGGQLSFVSLTLAGLFWGVRGKKMAIGVGGIFGMSTYWFLACCLYLSEPVCAAAGTVVTILVAWSFNRSFSQR